MSREHGRPCNCPVLASLDHLADSRQPPVPHRWRSIQRRVLLVCWICLIILGTRSPAQADPGADKAAIIARLEHWASAFNQRDVAGVCDLFSRNLISTVPGALAAGHDTVCSRLTRLLEEPGQSLRYRPDIKEIIVSGNLAMVRLFWTLTTVKDGRSEQSLEAGMDLFERQADGRWSIIRFVAFSI